MDASPVFPVFFSGEVQVATDFEMELRTSWAEHVGLPVKRGGTNFVVHYGL